VAVHLHVVHGPAAHVLLAAARHADLLVVGDRGIGGFLGLLLGSTAEQVLRHAPCAVAVVRS
jgi:nucleotide-binding universal stress UspA family protein